MKIDCGGYRRLEALKLRFKHCDSRTIASLELGRQEKQSLVSPGSRRRDGFEAIQDLQTDEESLAVGFFLTCYITTGQRLDSGQSFFDNILPTLSKANASSALSSAFSAVATHIYSQWRYGIARVRGLPKMRLVQALEHLQAALKDPEESRTLSTLMATLLLQFLDNITSVQRLQCVSLMHQNGALALVRQTRRAGFEDAHSRYIVQRLICVESSSAADHGRSLLADLTYCCDTDDSAKSPDRQLDALGLRVADLERTESQVWQDQASSNISDSKHASMLSALSIQAAAIDKDLIAWSSSVPSSWIPYKLNPERLRHACPPIQTYGEECDVYPSIQVASLWNTWRSYRLVAQTTLLSCLSANLPTPESITYHHTHTTATISIRAEIQPILDALSASVPFHLGNRTAPASLADFSNPALEFPAYHCFLDSDISRPDRLKHAAITPRDEHNRHVIAQGPWHVLHALSRTLERLAKVEGRCGVVWGIRKGQVKWLEGQVGRCMTVLGVEGGDRLRENGDGGARGRGLLARNVGRAIARG